MSTSLPNSAVRSPSKLARRKVKLFSNVEERGKKNLGSGRLGRPDGIRCGKKGLHSGL